MSQKLFYSMFKKSIPKPGKIYAPQGSFVIFSNNYFLRGGYIDDNFKIALIAEANLFLMPSRIEKKSVEGFGISFVEAASYGVASIGGKDGGASDAISHNKTGLICDGNDLNSIYDSVVSFFRNENFVKFGKNAQEFSKKFHWDKVVKNYLKLIN